MIKTPHRYFMFHTHPQTHIFAPSSELWPNEKYANEIVAQCLSAHTFCPGFVKDGSHFSVLLFHFHADNHKI